MICYNLLILSRRQSPRVLLWVIPSTASSPFHCKPNLLSKRNWFFSSAWRIYPKTLFVLTCTFRKSDNLETKREWLQTECLKGAFDFRKLYISFSQYWQNVPGTILFREPNNIVWGVKQYSFTCQTLLFRARKSNLWKMKRKKKWVSFSRRWTVSTNRKVIKSIGQEGWCIRMQTYPIPMCDMDTLFVESVAKCILRIARGGPSNPPNCILVRGRALWRASFDILSEG